MFARDTVYLNGVFWSVDVCHWPSVQLENGEGKKSNELILSRTHFVCFHCVTWKLRTSVSRWKLPRLLGACLFTGNMDRNGDQGLCDSWWQMLKLSFLPEDKMWFRSAKISNTGEIEFKSRHSTFKAILKPNLIKQKCKEWIKDISFTWSCNCGILFGTHSRHL